MIAEHFGIQQLGNGPMGMLVIPEHDLKARNNKQLAYMPTNGHLSFKYPTAVYLGGFIEGILKYQ